MRLISDAVYKHNGLPAFQLETVLFSLFYPAEKGAISSHPKHFWISKPISLVGEGFARFAHVNNFLFRNLFTFGLWALGGRLQIPAEVDVPLHGSAATIAPVFPMIVFSHGMASSRNDYTQYCAELASRGYIVAAIEHRDGSSPASVIFSAGGDEKVVFNIRPDDIKSKTSIDIDELKRIQLAFRQAEVEETVEALRSIQVGRGGALFKNNPRGEGATLQDWTGRLSFDNLVVAGHSYGATLALQTLRGVPSQDLPIRGAIILDPGKQSGRLNKDVSVPTLVIHSDSWSKRVSMFFGRPHFQVVKELVEGINRRGKAAWFLTSVGTSHPSVTDAPLIEPLLLSWTTGSTIDVKDGIREYVQVSHDFLNYLDSSERKGVLGESVTHPQYGEDNRDEKRKKGMPADFTKFWQVHVAPDINR
ncbi:putative paf-acetylhydrolase family member [Phaeomoniella chlamydospora]|uniref:Putative phospholipase n=1 Tax=Phaeomoniella chlamydospora TaxID=158046 RepID=A0A0G2E731_PHACM|nr:putative paf-acetylhydrolase family member [Phaeomoniella chlamydospora]